MGLQVSRSLHTELVLDALEMGMLNRTSAGADLSGLIHQICRGLQHTAVRYSQRLAQEGAVASVGSKGDPYDNGMAEAFNSLFKAEVVRRQGPWRGIDDLEVATVEYVDWYKRRRLQSRLDLVPPPEYETAHASDATAQIDASTTVGENSPSIKPGA